MANRPRALIGFHCPVCGYLRPAKGRLQVSVPPCAGSKARTGTQREPTPMQALFLSLNTRAWLATGVVDLVRASAITWRSRPLG